MILSHLGLQDLLEEELLRINEAANNARNSGRPGSQPPPETSGGGDERSSNDELQKPVDEQLSPRKNMVNNAANNRDKNSRPSEDGHKSSSPDQVIKSPVAITTAEPHNATFNANDVSLSVLLNESSGTSEFFLSPVNKGRGHMTTAKTSDHFANKSKKHTSPQENENPNRQIVPSSLSGPLSSTPINKTIRSRLERFTDKKATSDLEHKENQSPQDKETDDSEIQEVSSDEVKESEKKTKGKRKNKKIKKSGSSDFLDEIGDENDVETPRLNTQVKCFLGKFKRSKPGKSPEDTNCVVTEVEGREERADLMKKNRTEEETVRTNIKTPEVEENQRPSKKGNSSNSSPPDHPSPKTPSPATSARVSQNTLSKLKKFAFVESPKQGKSNVKSMPSGKSTTNGNVTDNVKPNFRSLSSSVFTTGEESFTDWSPASNQGNNVSSSHNRSVGSDGASSASQMNPSVPPLNLRSATPDLRSENKSPHSDSSINSLTTSSQHKPPNKLQKLLSMNKSPNLSSQISGGTDSPNTMSDFSLNSSPAITKSETKNVNRAADILRKINKNLSRPVVAVATHKSNPPNLPPNPVKRTQLSLFTTDDQDLDDEDLSLDWMQPAAKKPKHWWAGYPFTNMN